ncbi:hypothetical protein AX15_003897 [Amanita polypyramis BW_CC]|nr:hypothetical protein AX15_003897 [Amanita polypyramis BW_CC]
MPDLAGTFSRSSAPSSYPLTTERLALGRPPWEPGTRFEIEKEMSRLRSNNKRLGEALGWVVDVMLQDESDAQDLARLRAQKREALESLAYVRDALMGNVAELEDERLFGEEELSRRKTEAEAKSPRVHIGVRAPAPASVIDSRLRTRKVELHTPWMDRAEAARLRPATRSGPLVSEDPLGVSRAEPEITGP